MKGIGLVIIVAGWMVAVSGLLISDALVVRGALALVGFGTSAAGIVALNSAHLENAIWKVRRS